MHGCPFNPEQGYYQSPVFPYGGTYPVRIQCPYCLNLFDINLNANHNMGYFAANPGYPENIYPDTAQMDYGYDNLYPQTENIHPMYYNKSGYFCPCENIHSPWDNNRMYTSNENPLQGEIQ